MIKACTACGAQNRIDEDQLQNGSIPRCGRCGRVFETVESAELENRAQPFGRWNIIARHWRGDYSLPVAYWVISFCTNFGAVIAVESINGWVNGLQGFRPGLILTGHLLSICLIASIAVWHMIGTWRSATNYTANPLNKGKYWGGIAKAMIVLGTLKTLGSLATMAPVTEEMLHIVFQDDPSIPDYTITITEGGTELKIDGGLKYGLVADLRKVLAAAPQVRTIDLESIGGRIGVGKELFELISERRLNTVTNGLCASACTIAFAGGAQRWMGVDARLGFHGGALAGMKPSDFRDVYDDVNRRINGKNGTSYAFLRKADAVPSSELWYPDRDELLRERVITARASGAASSIRDVEAQLKKVSGEARKKLPQRIDEMTVLVGTVVEGYRYVFVYEISDEGHRALRTKAAQEGQEESVRGSFCESPATKRDVSKGLIYGFAYYRQTTRERSLYFEVQDCPTTSR